MPIVPNGSSLTITGTVDTTGDPISLQSTGQFVYLIVGNAGNSTVTITGPGGIVMSDVPTGGTNQIFSYYSNVTLDNQSTISGAGQIYAYSGMSLLNDTTGIIDANATHALDVANISVVNKNIMKSTNTGGLSLSSATIDQTSGGTLLASGGDVIIGGSTRIIGGSLSSTGASLIKTTGANGILDGSQVGNPVTITAGSTMQISDGSGLSLTGTTVANGTLRLNSTGGFAYLQIGTAANETVTLKGPSGLVLSDVSTAGTNQIFSYYTNVTFDNQSTISGAGQIYAYFGMKLLNDTTGIINANATHALDLSSITVVNKNIIKSTNTGGLSLSGATIDQTSGGTLLASGGDVIIGGSTQIIGGNLSTTGTSLIKTTGSNGILDGTQVGKPVTITAGSQVDISNSTGLYIKGTIDNRGQISVGNGPSTGYGYLQIGNTNGESVSLTGGGYVNLFNTGQSQIFSYNTGVTLHNVDNVIRGAGQIYAFAGLSLVNEVDGIITANLPSGGALTLNLPATNNGNMQAAFGGTLNVNGLTNYVGSTLTGGSYVAYDASTVQLNTSAGTSITTLAADVVLEGSGVLRAGSSSQTIEQSLTTIASGGRLGLLSHNSTWSNAIVNSGALGLDNTIFTSAAGLTITSGGLAGGTGEFNTAIVNNGSIVAATINFLPNGNISYSSGTLKFDLAVSGTGNVLIYDGSIAEFVSTASQTSTSFDGIDNATLDTLIIDNAAGFTSTVRNMQYDDRIKLTGLNAASAAITGYNAGTDTSTLTVKNSSGAVIDTITLAGNYTGRGFDIDSNGAIKLNRPPVVATLPIGSVGEDGPAFTQNLLAGATDPENNTLSVVNPDATITTSGGRVLTLGADYTITGGQFALTTSGFAKFNSLAGTQTDSIVLHFGVSDGLNAAVANTLTVTVQGANDTATITGTATGAVSEDGTLTVANTTLTVTDPDAGQSTFQAPTSLAGTYGTFTFNASTGVWGYALANGQANVQALAAGQTVHDTLTVKSTDGTATQIIDVMINGTNDAPVVTGSINLGAATAGTPITITEAQLLANATDVDAGAVLHVAGAVTASSGTIVDNGIVGGVHTWTYTGSTAGPVTLTYGVTDGTVTTPVSDTATLTVAAGGDVIDQPTATTVNGTPNADQIIVHGPNKYVNGLAGNDIFTIATDAGGGRGTFHYLNGGHGSDTLDLSRITSNMIINLDDCYARDVPAKGMPSQTGLLILNSIENVKGGSGNDLIIGNEYANILDGGDGNDAIYGGCSNDRIIGGAGNDIMAGGFGSDTFVFKPGFGKDIIADFSVTGANHDYLELSLGSAFDTFAEVLAATTQMGTDAVIAIDANNSIILKNVQKTALIADDFRFV